MKLKYVTLTGADENTSVAELKKLSHEYPFVEWAFLLSNDGKADRERYPSVGWIANAVAELEECNIAIHVCGPLVAEYIYGLKDFKWLTRLTGAYNFRIQLNIPRYIDIGSQAFIGHFFNFLTKHPHMQFIIQHNDSNADSVVRLLKNLSYVQLNNVQVLRDCSGGRGVREDSWNLPKDLPGSTFYGFAGGIGPDTITEDLIALEALLGDKSTWVDMESKIRYNILNLKRGTVLDLVACKRVLEIAKNYV